MAVIRIETSSPTLSTTQREAAVDSIVDAVRTIRPDAVQVDFDARVSERLFYAAVLRELRARLPPGLFLSITALVSWCGPDSWLDGLPVDEVVPMTFEMGAAAAATETLLGTGGRFQNPACRGSIGVSLRELPLRPRNFHRTYVFAYEDWTGPLTRSCSLELDRVLKLPLSKSSRNLYRGLRMRAAADLMGFLDFASRIPVLLTTDSDGGEVATVDPWPGSPLVRAAGQRLLDRDSIKTLNERAPMRVLRQAALGGAVPKYGERDFVLSAFTRALLLDDAENGLPLSARLRAIGADTQNYLAAYRDARDPAGRRFAGVFYILHHPESRPYFSSGKWDERAVRDESMTSATTGGVRSMSLSS